MYYEKGHFYSKSNWLFNFRVMVVNKMCLQLPKSKQSISKKKRNHLLFWTIWTHLWRVRKLIIFERIVYILDTVCIHTYTVQGKTIRKRWNIQGWKEQWKKIFHSNGYFILSQIEVGHISTWMKWYKANKRGQILT